MFYDALSRNTVKITLSEKDMRDYSIKSDSIHAHTAESKRSLTRFLKKFQSESSLFAGCSADRLFLEAFPSDDGGCVLYVSTLGAEKPKRETSVSCRKQMCMTESFSDMIKLCYQIKNITETSVLFRNGCRYSLVITADSSTVRDIARIMEEYGEYSEDKTDIASVSEHGRLICAADAAERLAELA